MNDIHLLEYAAKAMQHSGDEKFRSFAIYDNDKFVSLNLGFRSGVLTQIWNPLDDNGDAFWLAVKLNICINFGFAANQINCEIYDWEEDEVKIDWKENGRKDPFTATRRAIVRCAAEVGKSL